jgi:hypothetical protein
MSAYANIFVDQGTDFSSVLNIADTRSDPIDLEDFNLYGQIRRTYTSASYYNFNIDVLDGLDGSFVISLDSETTKIMKPGRYVYDIFARSVDGSLQYKLVEGSLEVIPSVTRFDDIDRINEDESNEEGNQQD